MLDGKNVLITGGTGSFGKKFIQIVLEEYKPEKLIVFSRDELKQFEMSQRWSAKKYQTICLLNAQNVLQEPWRESRYAPFL